MAKASNQLNLTTTKKCTDNSWVQLNLIELHSDREIIPCTIRIHFSNEPIALKILKNASRLHPVGCSSKV